MVSELKEATAPGRPKYLGWFVCLCVAFAGIQLTTSWNWGLPGYASWAPDSIGLNTLKWAKGGMRYLPGLESPYPPVHQYILAATYVPLVTWHWARGNLNLEDGTAHNEVAVRTSFLRLGRLVTIILAVGVMIILFRLGQRLGPCGSGLLAAGLWCGTYTVAYYSQTTNVDVPYIFWMLFSLERLVVFRQTGRLPSLFASAVFAGLCVGTKDQAAAIIVAFPVLLAWFPFRSDDKERRGAVPVGPRLIAVWMLVSLGTYGIVSQAFLRPRGYWEHLQTVFGPARFSRKLGDWELLVAYTGEFLVAAHPLVVTVLVMGMVGVALKSWRLFLWLLIPVVCYHIVFIGGSGILAARFLLPHLTVLALMGGIVTATVLRRRLRLRNVAIPIITFACYLSGLSMNRLLWHDPRAAAEDWLQQHPDIRNSLATHCFSDPYLPSVAQRFARKVWPLKGRPIDVEERYLICVSAYYDRHLHGRDESARQAWRELLAGQRGFRPIARFTSRPSLFPGAGLGQAKPRIPGLAQSIQVLQRERGS